MFSCKDVTEKANQYIDSELPFSQRLNMRLHLFVCVNCRLYLKQLQTTIQVLGRMRKPEAAPTSEAKVNEIVEKLKKEKQAGNPSPHGHA
jgi:hypothetical protein